jgi:GMP synthase-like glutamine amidotransferase
MRVLVIQHERSAPAGLLGEWLEARGADVRLAAVEDAAALSPSPRDHDLIVSLGSEASAYDDAVPWLAGELELLAAAAAAGVPVLGICFGSQLLARALGARVTRAERPEIGWLEVRSHAPELVPPGPWFQWHFDSFELPPGATLLAGNESGPQAFVRERCVGLQFHPEVDAEIVAGWVAAGRRELRRHGFDGEQLLARTRSCAGPARELAMRLFDAVHERIAPADDRVAPPRRRY